MACPHTISKLPGRVLTRPDMPSTVHRVRTLRAAISLAMGVTLCSLSGGCSSSPAPQGAEVPANLPLPVAPQAEAQNIVTGGADSVGSIPGSPGAQFVYVFRQTDPASDRFTFQDRDLSFYFRPSPTVLHFQVENRQDRPVWIEWERCVFYDSFGGQKRVANSETTWSQRYSSLPATQIIGLQRYSNYVFPIDYMIDPGASHDQLHRPLFPEDKSAPQYVNREVGVTLMFRLQDRLQPYAFRFKVRSVLPR